MSWGGFRRVYLSWEKEKCALHLLQNLPFGPLCRHFDWGGDRWWGWYGWLFAIWGSNKGEGVREGGGGGARGGRKRKRLLAKTSRY